MARLGTGHPSLRATVAKQLGSGDFADLDRLCQIAGEAGGSVVATNPFHALLPRRPSDASPYSPSSRIFLNPIYIDISAVPGFLELPRGAAVGGDALRASQNRICRLSQCRGDKAARA